MGATASTQAAAEVLPQVERIPNSDTGRSPGKCPVQHTAKTAPGTGTVFSLKRKFCLCRIIQIHD